MPWKKNHIITSVDCRTQTLAFLYPLIYTHSLSWLSSPQSLVSKGWYKGRRTGGYALVLVSAQRDSIINNKGSVKDIQTLVTGYALRLASHQTNTRLSFFIQRWPPSLPVWLVDGFNYPTQWKQHAEWRWRICFANVCERTFIHFSVENRSCSTVCKYCIFYIQNNEGNGLFYE